MKKGVPKNLQKIHSKTPPLASEVSGLRPASLLK